MIVYGTGGSDLGQKQLDYEKCPSCGEKGQLHLQGVSRYFSLFWIPVLPFSKKIHTFCGACDKEITKAEYTQELRTRINSEKSDFKFPIANFAGAIIIGLIAIWGFYQNYQRNEYVADKIQHIEVGDILILKEEYKKYYFLIVDSKEDDIMTFRYTNYYLDQKPTRQDYTDGLRDNNDFIDTAQYILFQHEIDSLYEVGDLDIVD